MRIDQSVLTLLNYYNKSANRLKFNSLVDVFTKKNPSKSLKTTHDMVSSSGNRKLNFSGIYNSKGKITNSRRLSYDIWDSNHERLPDNNSPVYLSPPKSIKQQLNELPAHLRYTGKLTSVEIAEKYAATGEIPPQEYYYLGAVNIALYEEAKNKSEIPRLAKRIDEALQAGGITVDADERFTIKVDRNNRITVEGIEDSERNKKIQDALQSYTIKNKYSFASLAIGIRCAYFLNSQKTNNLSLDMRSLALANFTASNFLYNATGGKVTSDDLNVANGKILGLPPELANTLNRNDLNGTIVNGQNLEGVRRCIIQVKTYESKYGLANLPNNFSSFTYQNGKLNLIEEPIVEENRSV